MTDRSLYFPNEMLKKIASYGCAAAFYMTCKALSTTEVYEYCLEQFTLRVERVNARLLKIHLRNTFIHAEIGEVGECIEEIKRGALYYFTQPEMSSIGLIDALQNSVYIGGFDTRRFAEDATLVYVCYAVPTSKLIKELETI